MRRSAHRKIRLSRCARRVARKVILVLPNAPSGVVKERSMLTGMIGPMIGLAVGVLCIVAMILGPRYIPHDRVGIVEKLWSSHGALRAGQLIALDAEAGYQAEILRGGVHWFYSPFQYRIRLAPLVTISEGRIGYVYARDGQPLTPVQTLGKVVGCNNFQDARAFLEAGGQRGRQRAILREGVYAINLSLFVVITESGVYCTEQDQSNGRTLQEWQSQLAAMQGFSPVVIGKRNQRQADTNQVEGADLIGIVTVHDGAPLETGEIIAPEVRDVEGSRGHDYFQNPEAFLALGGRRGKQLQVITDGTFFLNRWFATVEFTTKTLIPIGYVGVVVSYHGTRGQDVTGQDFRYGEQVEAGMRGVWKRALPPGKYALNPYAMTVELVPTVNFVLRWITGQVEQHEYDKELKSIEIITADGFEPVLPLSLVLHIDYEKASSVVQRFGDVKRLISQTLDPILSAYFRDVAQSTQMLDLLTHREEIQSRATAELGRRFRDYDITCVAVLIGRPESVRRSGETGADPIERLFDQLRARRLAEEQIETFEKQRVAAGKLKELHNAQAQADKQIELTRTAVDVEIAGNRGEAQLAEARRLAECDVVRAEGDSKARELHGKGEASRIAQTGLAEAAVFLRKIRAYGEPQLFALNMVAEHLAGSKQPLVPERVFQMGGTDSSGSQPGTGLLGALLALMTAEKAGVGPNGEDPNVAVLEQYATAVEDAKESKPAEQGKHQGRVNEARRAFRLLHSSRIDPS